MDSSSLSPVQLEIAKALTQLGDKSRYSETLIAKKIRENIKLEGKKKAGIGLQDLEKAVQYIEETTDLHFALIMNSANDLLIEKTQDSRPLAQDARQRRLKSEKSLVLFTNSDVSSKKSGTRQKSKRTERHSININSEFEDYDE